RIEPAAMTAKIKYPAMIASLEYEDLRPLGDGARSADGHQIGLGSRVRKAHQLDRREPGADRRRETRLEQVVRAKIEAALERRLDRIAYRGMRMAIDPGGELAEEIDIFVPVEIPQPRPLATHDRQRKRVDMDRRAGISAGHHGAGLSMP